MKLKKRITIEAEIDEEALREAIADDWGEENPTDEEMQEYAETLLNGFADEIDDVGLNYEMLSIEINED